MVRLLTDEKGNEVEQPCILHHCTKGKLCPHAWLCRQRPYQEVLEEQLASKKRN